MTTLVLPRVAIAAVRAIQWPIRRLGPYSCVLGFLIIGAVTLGLSRAVLIGWQWERVDPTDSFISMLLQGLRSDLITLSLLAAQALSSVRIDRVAKLVNPAHPLDDPISRRRLASHQLRQLGLRGYDNI